MDGVYRALSGLQGDMQAISQAISQRRRWG
jgi:hypothetical protein